MAESKGRPGSAGQRPTGGDKALATQKKQYFRRKKVCRFCVEKIDDINYKDMKLLHSFIAERGFTLFRVIDHSGTAERVGVQMPDSKLVMFGNPAKGAAVMLAAPLAALDLPLKVLVWEDAKGVVSVSYNSPGFMAERLHIEGAHRAPFDAVESIVEAVLGA